MRVFCRKILESYLKWLNKLALLLHRPFIIAIAGSANKNFFREAIKNKLLEQDLSVRSNPKSFNTRIGLPLAILDLPSGYHSYKNWLPIILQAPLAAFKKFPQVLVLELGVWNRGDMKHLLSIIRPDIAILTDITQKYLEGFADLDELFEEYNCFIKKAGKKGTLILNYDNAQIRAAAAAAKFFSLESKRPELIAPADFYQAEILERGDKGERIKVVHNGEKKLIELERFGAHHAQALLASLAVSDTIKDHFQ